MRSGWLKVLLEIQMQQFNSPLHSVGGWPSPTGLLAVAPFAFFFYATNC
jgi:hypothetical protein